MKPKPFNELGVLPKVITQRGPKPGMIRSNTLQEDALLGNNEKEKMANFRLKIQKGSPLNSARRKKSHLLNDNLSNLGSPTHQQRIKWSKKKKFSLYSNEIDGLANENETR